MKARIDFGQVPEFELIIICFLSVLLIKISVKEKKTGTTQTPVTLQGTLPVLEGQLSRDPVCRDLYGMQRKRSVIGQIT